MKLLVNSISLLNLSKANYFEFLINSSNNFYPRRLCIEKIRRNTYEIKNKNPFTGGINYTSLHHSHSKKSSFKTFMSLESTADGRKHDSAYRSSEFYNMHGISVREHWLNVPLDHSGKEKGTITIFAREVVDVLSIEKDFPYLVFLQGGPGFESPRPIYSSGWIKKACESHRVLLLDQRGTGLSTSVTAYCMSMIGNAEDQLNYLKHFRADSIVKDAELLRAEILPDGSKWSILGQSYGGFCAVAYLSIAPEGLKNVLLTGGLPPLAHVDDVYRECYDVVLRKNKQYYARFPNDVEKIQSIVLHISESEQGRVPLPSGGFLTVFLFQLLGIRFGASGGYESLHYLIEIAWETEVNPNQKKKLSYNFLRAFENIFSFDTNPIYAVLHEAIYCQEYASEWSADRMRKERENAFDAIECIKQNKPVLFTGEMIYPWMFKDFSNLQPFADVAEMISKKNDWPKLYDIEKLNKNKVPVAALIYYDDLYVSRNLSLQTADQIQGIKLWITNEYEHSGIRDDGEAILKRLLAMLNGSIMAY